jgi:probable F420-dependent oxidoreductase
VPSSRTAPVKFLGDCAVDHRASIGNIRALLGVATHMTANGLGRLGMWVPHSKAAPEIAGELERLGYSALWLGASPAAELDVVDPLLAATERLIVGTSIVNVWTAPAKSVAESFHRLEDAYPGRFLLGIGAGHRENDADYRKPYGALVDYLDELDQGGVPVRRRALAALGPRVMELARTRTAGALPYLVTPDHTRRARAQLGPDPLLVAEQKVVLDDNPTSARELGRERVGPYLHLSNYVTNLRRVGFDDDDVSFPGSDRLVDALAVHGDPESVAAGLRAHLAAGANQVAIQAISANGDILSTARALAERLQPT